MSWVPVPASGGTCAPAGYGHRGGCTDGGWSTVQALSSSLPCKQRAVSTPQFLFLVFVPVVSLAKLPARSPRRGV